MDGVFASRKESFINSLQKSIATVSSDKYISQMFEDQHSAIYVPDRICELIKQVLVSEREDEINSLYNRIYAIEFFFDDDKIKQIETLGKKYIQKNANSPNNSISNNNYTFGFGDAPDYDGQSSSFRNTNNSSQSQNFKMKKQDIIAFCKILDQQLISLKMNKEKNEQIPRIFNDLKQSIRGLKNAMYSVKNDFSTLLKRTKNKTLKLYQLSTDQVKQDYVEKIKNAKYFINKQNEQIKQLSNSSMYDANSVSILESNLQKLKNKLSQSEENVASSLDKITSLQQQLFTAKNENQKLEEKNNMLTFENRQITEVLNEKQQRIDYLEQSMSNIENEIPEPDQMNKIQQKMINLNETIRKIQDENDNLQKKSSSNDKTLSDLMHLTSTANESDLVSKVDRLYKEKVKICQILNRSVHSDPSKAVEMIHQTHEAIKSILDISDDDKLVSEVQNLKEQKKSIKKMTEKESTIRDVFTILNAENEKDLKNKVQTLQRLKTAFDKLCSNCGIRLDNDLNSFNYNLPEAVNSFQKAYKNSKEVSSILNLNAKGSSKEFLSELIEIRNKTSDICEIFHLKDENNPDYIPITKLVKVAKNLVKIKQSYDTIVSSLNTSVVAFNKNDSFLFLDFENFDEERARKARLNARSFILMKSNLKTICGLLKIDFKFTVKKILSTLVNQVKSLVKTKENYEKVIESLNLKQDKNDEDGILMNEKAIRIIRSLVVSKKNADTIGNLIDGNKNDKDRQQTVESLLDTKERYNEVCNVLKVSKLDQSIAAEVGEIWSTIKDLCMIFKIDQPELNSSLQSIHQSICSRAKSLQESYSKNLASVYNISIRLKHFKQVSRNLKIKSENNEDEVVDDLRSIENELIQIMNDLSNIFVCFGTSDYSEIKLAKMNFENQKKEIQNLSQFTGKESIEESIEFLSKYFGNIKQSSAFLCRLFRILLLLPGSPNSKSGNELMNSNSPVLSSVDGIPLPIPRSAQERLLSLASQQNIEKVQLKSAIEKVIDKARSLGFTTSFNNRISGFDTEINSFSTDNNEILSSIDSALDFIVDAAKRDAEAKFETTRIHLEKQLLETKNDLQSSKLKYKNRIKDLNDTMTSMNSKNSEKSEKQFLEMQDLRKRLDDTLNLLENEKKIRSELIIAVGKRDDNIDDGENLRSKLSASELLLLSKAEKTRKVVDEMKMKKRKK